MTTSNLLTAVIALVFALTLSVATAETRIAVLDFELNDLTLNPNGPEEQSRTASVAPLLREALAAHQDCALVEITADAQQQADVAFGYLYDHPNVAARLGQRFGADWIAVGRVHKPSYLFAYLKVHLVDAKTGRLADELIVEVKGSSEKLTRRGTKRLAEQITESLADR